MSYTFTLSQKSSLLSSEIYPPIVLKDTDVYVLGLVNFVSYNSVPNVDNSNNTFYYDKDKKIILPEGTYEISDINTYIGKYLEEHEKEISSPTAVHIQANRNTLKCEIKCNKKIDFEKPNNIGSLFGFKPKQLTANVRHESDYPVNIFNINSINVECNLVNNSYSNNQEMHILHVFYPNVLPGTKIIENPTNVIYLPINTQYINEIVVKITDQEGKLINFKEEIITVRLHLKKLSA